MYVDIAKSCLAGEENSVLSENTNSSIDDISFVPYDRIKSKKGLAFTSPFFLSSAHEKDIFAVSLVGSEPLQALLGSMTSLLHLGFHFHAADEHHLDLLLGFYDDALQDLADHCIVISEYFISPFLSL